MNSEPFPDYYAVLGVDDDASAEEISRAYRLLARQCHPDKLAESATPQQKRFASERFKSISAAVSVLRDPHARAAYDKDRERYRRRAGSAPGSSGAPFFGASDPSGTPDWKGAANEFGFGSSAGGGQSSGANGTGGRWHQNIGLSEAFAVWLEDVVLALQRRRAGQNPSRMVQTVQLISVIGIPAVLAYMGPSGVKAGLHLMSLLNGSRVAQELLGMAPEEQVALQRALQLIDRYLDRS